MACHEETGTDARSGAIVNANLAEYPISVADVPDLRVHMLDEADPVSERLGVKGVGMIGTVGTAAAIANAVFHATGKWVRDLPIRPERLL